MILINEDWGIDADQYNIIVLQRKVTKESDNAGKESWIPQSYHGSYEQAYLWVLDQSARQAPQEIGAMLEAMKRAEANIIAAIDEQGIKCRRCSLGDDVA